MSEPPQAVRLDKWLWAARFFKTRSLAKAAIEGGKVLYDGQRPKVSRDVVAGATLTIRQGWDEFEVIVGAISDQRGPASVAQQLYQETAASVARREQATADRKAHRSATVFSPERPSKKQRRQIHRFRDQTLE